MNMRKFKFTINNNLYDIEIVNIIDNIAEVSVNGEIFTAEMEKSVMSTKTPKLVRSVAVPSTDSIPSTAKTTSPSAPKGSGNLKSPLPGKVLNVLVKQGDMVSIGQKVLVLEAMKMENNINSDKEGKVTSVNVKKGDNVMEGDILVVIG